MGLFQQISDHLRLSPAIRNAQLLCRRLFHDEHLDAARMDAFISVGDDAVEVFRLQLRNENDSSTVEQRQQVLDMLGRVKRGDDGVVTVIGLLSCFIDDENNILVAKALAYLANLGATDALLKALKTKNRSTRRYVVKALSNTVEINTVPVLIEALDDDDARIRSDIVTALANFPDKRVIQTLLDRLADPNWLVRDSASSALALINHHDILMRLDQQMTNPQHVVRVQVLRVISKMDANCEQGYAMDVRTICSEKLNIMIAALDDAHIEVRSEAVDALAMQPHRAAIVPLLLHYHLAAYSLRERIFQACQQIGIQRVITHLSHDDRDIRIAVAEMLAQYGDSEFLPLLTDAWQFERDEDVQMWIVIALGQQAIRLGDSAPDATIKVLIQAAESEKDAMAYHARKALESIASPLAEQFVKAPLKQMKFTIACPNCLETLELELPLTGKRWDCQNCFLGFKIRPGDEGAMIISALKSKQQVILPNPQNLHWYEVLGINVDADVSTIKSGFRTLLKQYHPDKVALLGGEFKLLAEEKTRLLTWALRTGLEKQKDR